MRSAWFVGSLSLFMFSAGCSCGSCGWGNCGRSAPAGYQQASTPTPQYNMAGSYASTPPGAPAAGGVVDGSTPGAMDGSGVVPATATSSSLSSPDDAMLR